LAALLGEETIRSEARTVGDLLDEVRRRVAPEDWEWAGRVAVLINGRNMHMLQGRKTPLEPDDQVWMIVPSGGG
jgi:molybdopterin converting factor small subunit